MLTDISSSPTPVSPQAKKRRKQLSLYFSSCKALRKSRMMKGKKSVSKTNDSAPENLRRAFRFGRGEAAQDPNVEAINLDSIDETTKDIAGVQNIPQPVEIPIVSFL